MFYLNIFVFRRKRFELICSFQKALQNESAVRTIEALDF